MRLLFYLLFSFLLIHGKAQDIDVQHYTYWLTLSDKTDRIEGTAEIKIRFLKPVLSFQLDLTGERKNGKGMKAESIKTTVDLGFVQKDEKLLITLKEQAQLNAIQTLHIKYNGMPEDGLIISKNKYGERTFFADNWPNRAHHWVPCNDRPDDKASVEFYVAAPKHYNVIANGLLQNDSIVTDWAKQAQREGHYFHWKQDVPIPTKVMVIGAARFAVKEFTNSPDSIPVSAWVYPQDSAKGFYDYALAVPILNFFSHYIAPYPYKKLANVQSKTIFGGMENASAIFYSEESVTGTRSAEDLIAHEVVHQWFGNSASEKSFAHLWLSEGFATYLTNVYIEDKYGKDSAVKRLQKDRDQIISFAKTHNRPVVDSVSDLMDLLNANSYQKGSWILHMLRQQEGDDAFQQIIRAYYNQYKGANANTRDFQAVVEKVTGKNWKPFFDQWLYQPGIPRVSVKWKLDAKRRMDNLTVSIEQRTPGTFVFPLEIGFMDKAGKVNYLPVEIKNKKQEIKFTVTKSFSKLLIDPFTKLLFEQL